MGYLTYAGEVDDLQRELSTSLTGADIDRYSKWSLETFGLGERTDAVVGIVSAEIGAIEEAIQGLAAKRGSHLPERANTELIGQWAIAWTKTHWRNDE